MADMEFMIPLMNFLREHGEIYTVRAYAYGRPDCNVVGVGPCRRELIAVSNVRDLAQNRYVALSGFDTVLEWREAISKFIKGNKTAFLYKVEVKKEF